MKEKYLTLVWIVLWLGQTMIPLCCVVLHSKLSKNKNRHGRRDTWRNTTTNASWMIPKSTSRFESNKFASAAVNAAQPWTTITFFISFQIEELQFKSCVMDGCVMAMVMWEYGRGNHNHFTIFILNFVESMVRRFHLYFLSQESCIRSFSESSEQTPK